MKLFRLGVGFLGFGWVLVFLFIHSRSQTLLALGFPFLFFSLISISGFSSLSFTAPVLFFVSTVQDSSAYFSRRPVAMLWMGPRFCPCVNGDFMQTRKELPRH